MKPIQIIAGVTAGALLALVLTGCGPKGGTLTLINESSYTLSSPSISLGGGSENTLVPGQWMQSSVDKNIAGATVKFTLSGGESKVTVNPAGKWEGLIQKDDWNSGLIGVQNGESVVVTVRNKND
jgi:hypothetical protein